MQKHHQPENWEWEIKPETTWLGSGLKELYHYKDLLFRLTRKDFLGSYQQTLLGPFWVLLQPLLTVITYVIVFNNVLKISTGTVPPFLFNLIGITLWNLFSEVFLSATRTFTSNIAVFSKVYFPRIIVALSSLLLQLILFGVQLLLLIVVCVFYQFTGHVELDLSHILLIIPAILTVCAIGFGGGLIFSVLTAKYRDLLALMNLLIRLLMFICPIFYSLSLVPEKWKWFVHLNPLSSQFELFRFAFLGTGSFSTIEIVYSVVFSILLVFIGSITFNKMGDKLMDVV